VKQSSPLLRLALLAVVCFSLATLLQPRTTAWNDRAQADNVLSVLLGDGRRLFANQFFVEADVSFHSGYYPSIFDQADKAAQSPMVSGKDEHHDDEAAGHDEDEHEKQMAFLKEPHDWIEAFGRHFIITEHTHLAGGQEREILPWLRVSAALDPQRIDTYTVAAYWLRSRLGKVKEAEDFLRDGLRANPNSPEILFELGQLYLQNHHDTNRARNVWELSLRRWQETEPGKKEPDEPNLFLLDKIAMNLAHLEEDAGNYDRAIAYIELAKKASPHPESLEQQIQEIKQKKAGGNAKPASPAN
jgi:tetratricopeptide (TPR) repeat protein